MTNDYGAQHKQIRAEYARQLAADGMLVCYRCHRPIYAVLPPAAALPSAHVPRCHNRDCEGQCWTHWDLGHTDDGTTWHGPEHTCCNRQAGGHNGAAHTNRLHAEQRKMVVRGW